MFPVAEGKDFQSGKKMFMSYHYYKNELSKPLAKLQFYLTFCCGCGEIVAKTMVGVAIPLGFPA